MAISRKTKAVVIDESIGCPPSHPIQVGKFCETRRIHCNLAVQIQTTNTAPEITLNQVRFVAEQSPIGTEVGAPLAFVDADIVAGKQQSITWQTTGCAPYETNTCPVRVDGCTGAITVIVSDTLDYETIPTITLTMIAADDGSPPMTSLATTVVIQVTDANDAPTIEAAQSFTVPENVLVGHTVGQVAASDVDVGDVLTYIDETTLDTPYSVSRSGLIVTTGVPNFEGSSSDVSLRVRVTDAGGLSSPIVLVAVAATDENDPPIVLDLDDADDSIVFSEKCSPGSDVTVDDTCQHVLQASDDDDMHPLTNEGSPLAWLIVSTPAGSTTEETDNACDTANLFTLSSTGILSTKENGTPLSFESFEYCYVWFQVQDSTGLSADTPRRAKIQILDVNEPPILTTMPSTCTVPEDTPVGRYLDICNVTISDPDTKEDPLQEVVVFQTQESLGGMRYDYAVTQKLLVIGSGLDFETNPTVSIQLTLRDDGTPTSIVQKTLVINIGDVNEPPMFLNLGVARSVSEDATPGTTITPSLTATDPDAGDSLTFFMVTSTTNVEVSSSDGALSVPSSGSTLDYETLPLLSLTVRVVDVALLEVEGIFDLSVLDANDAPTLNQVTRAVKISVNPPVGSHVGPTWTASDQDAGHGETLVFHAEDDSAGLNYWQYFTLNQNTGQTTIKDTDGSAAMLDASTFTLKVRAKDEGGMFSGWGTMTVTVVEGLSIPVISNTQVYYVDERSVLNTVVTTTLECTDIVSLAHSSFPPATSLCFVFFVFYKKHTDEYCADHSSFPLLFF